MHTHSTMCNYLKTLKCCVDRPYNPATESYMNMYINFMCLIYVGNGPHIGFGKLSFLFNKIGKSIKRK